MTIALISDTHGLLRPEVVEALQGSVEKILHLGDVGNETILRELEAIAPVVAVRGNVDRGALAARLPGTAVTDIFGANAYLLHNLDELDIDPAAAGMQFVLFGHTHKPYDQLRDGVRYLNPGSIGPRRFSLPISFALVEADLRVRFVQL